MDKYTHNIKVVAGTSLVPGTTIYSGRFVNRGSYSIDNLVALACQRTSNVSDVDVKAFLMALFTVARNWSQSSVWSGTYCGIRFRPVINGGFDAIDSAWNDNVNRWNLDAGFINEIWNCMDNVVPHIITTDDEVLTRIKREGDLATDTPNVVVQGDDFVLTGTNMYLGRTGEKVELHSANDSWVCSCSQDNGPTSKVLYVRGIESGTPHPLPTTGFQGTLRIYSYGKDRTGGALMTDVKNVSFMPKAEAAGLELPYMFGCGVGLNKLSVSDATLKGSKIRMKGADRSNIDLFKIRYYKTDGETYEEAINDGEVSTDDGMFEFKCPTLTNVDLTKPATIFTTMFESKPSASLTGITLVA